MLCVNRNTIFTKRTIFAQWPRAARARPPWAPGAEGPRRAEWARGGQGAGSFMMKDCEMLLSPLCSRWFGW